LWGRGGYGSCGYVYASLTGLDSLSTCKKEINGSILLWA
jgi:hypothetical protein